MLDQIDGTCLCQYKHGTHESRAIGRTRSRTPHERGGTIINVITAIIFFGLIGMGVWWVIKTTGQATQQYSNAMINTSKKATAVVCQTNLRSISQNLQMYGITNEHFPQSQQELVDFGGNSRLFHCPDPNGSEYVYIPGQGGDMPATNVIVYETKPVHQGRCNVLFFGGQIEALTPDELKQALAATQATLHRR
jgi:prepilin-type processing-associated H-X9-DG protein